MHHITDHLHRHKNAPTTQQTAPLVKPTSVPLNAQGLPITQSVPVLEKSFASTTLNPTVLPPQHATLQQATLLPLQQLPLQQQAAPLQQQAWTQQQALGQQQGWTSQEQQGWTSQQQQGWIPQQQQGWQQQTFTQQTMAGPTLLKEQPLMHTTTRAPVVETHVRAPIIEQTTRINKVVEIQPIIHREIDAPQVRVIEQHSYERAALAGPSMITRAAIIEETIKPTVVEEIQPILHREVPAPFVERVEQHTTEHVTAPTTSSKQVFSESRTLGVQEATERGFVSAPMVQPINQQPILHTHTAAPIIESRMRNTVVEQTARPEKILEVQPVIHREIDAPQVRVIEKHSFEKVRSTGPALITKQAIVEERVTPKITEEIHPILHREVPAPFIERVQQHTQEHVVAPTTTTKQVLTERTMAAPVQLVPTQRAAPSQPILRSTTALPTTEHLERPAIIQQTSRPEKITEVQPVIHREIDAPQVRVIEQHSYEKQRSMGPSLITKPAIVEEVIIPTIVEEIQPVIHREVPQTVIERQEQHTTEHLVKPTVSTKEVMRDTTAKMLPAVGMERSLSAPLAGAAPILRSTTAATQVQTHTRPTLVQQTARPEKITEVQPVIHREIDAPSVRVIEKHLYEKVPSAGPTTITKQAIIEETLHPKIIEEVQPVVHRTVPAPFVERVEQHTTEHITQPTMSTKEVIVDRSATNFVAAGGLPATATRSTTTTTTGLATSIPPAPAHLKKKHHLGNPLHHKKAL